MVFTLFDDCRPAFEFFYCFVIDLTSSALSQQQQCDNDVDNDQEKGIELYGVHGPPAYMSGE